MANDIGLAPAAPTEQYVYGVRMPGDGDNDPESVAQWLLALQAAGIRRICSLMSADEVEEYEIVLDVAYQKMFGRDHVYTDESIEDDELIDADRLLDALTFIEESERLKMPVAVHCGESEFRALQVLSLWLMTARGTPAPQAVAAVRSSGRKPPAAITYLPSDAELIEHLEEIRQAWQSRR